MKEDLVRVLNVVPNMRAAGVETFIMNVYRNIDRTRVQFDFLVHSEKKEFYDDEIEKLGGKIYRLTYKDDKNFFKYIKDLNDFFSEHKEYEIVHGHMQSMMPVYLKVAKNHNVKIRIGHSHNNSYEKSMKGILLHILSRSSKKYANIKFACSVDSGKYLFGKKTKVEVINNGIEIDKFKFEESKRNKIREELKLNDDDILIGNIGRMEKQKNQMFLVEVFKKLHEENKKYKLIIIGEGRLENKIKKQISKYQLENVTYIKKRIKNVNEYMMAMDMFALPSLYEGLGIVLIEGQASGLKCFTTLNTVAEETNITSNIKYLKLNKNVWKNAILNTNARYDRTGNMEKECKEFDIKNVAKKLENLYLNY